MEDTTTQLNARIQQLEAELKDAKILGLPEINNLRKQLQASEDSRKRLERANVSLTEQTIVLWTLVEKLLDRLGRL